MVRKVSLPVLGISALVFAVAVGGMAVLGWKAFSVTDPYVVPPRSSSPAPAGAQAGYAVTGRTLTVTSARDVVVVADPGESFKYLPLWIIERPGQDGALTTREYELSPYTPAEKIHPPGEAAPEEIREAAEGWR